MILIAEDDRDMSSVISTFLSSRGFATVVAFDATQAVMLAMRTPPSAIVLDINLPGGSGLNVLRRVKQSAKTSQVPVVVLTATTDPTLPQTAAQLGADAFLSKPPDLRKLERTLRRLLGLGEDDAEALGEGAVGERADDLEEAIAGARVRLMADFPLLVLDLGAAVATLDRSARALKPTAPEPDLIARLHNVAGRAGTLGFGTLGVLASQLERQLVALEPGTADRTALMSTLREMCGAFAADVTAMPRAPRSVA